MGNWIWHGRDKKQCWSEPNCLICYTRAFFDLVRLRTEVGKMEGGRREAESTFICRECDFKTRDGKEVSKHQKDTGHKIFDVRVEEDN